MSILALFEDGWASTRPSSSSVGRQVASSGTSVGGGGGAGGRDIFCSVGPAVNGRGRTRRGTGTPRSAPAAGPGPGPCVPSLENRGPPFLSVPPARSSAATRPPSWPLDGSLWPCSAPSPALLLLLLGHSSHSQAPHRRCLPLKKATAEPMCGTAMSERDDWCSSSSSRPGRSGGRPSALRTGRPDIRTARRLFRRFSTSHSQPLFTRESLAPRGNQRLRYACQHRSLERTLLLFFIHSPLKSTRRREIESQPETASRLPVAAKQKPAAVPVLYALCRVHGPDAGFRTPVRRRPQVHCTNGMHVCVYTYTSCPIPPVASPNQTVEVVLSSLKAR
jgi:hypothetical protein